MDNTSKIILQKVGMEWNLASARIPNRKVSDYSTVELDREFMFQNTNLPQRSFLFFSRMRRLNKFCDIVFSIGNWSIAAHRVILASVTPEFEEIMLHQEEVPVSDIDPSVFECLIDYVYNCKLKITLGNVKSLLSGACWLRMKDVQDACCDFLIQRLHPVNVLDCMDLADSLNLPQLKEFTDLYVKENFEEISKTDRFLNCSFTYLRELIGKDDLNVQSEEKVLESVLRWVKVSIKDRKDKLTELLRQVRMVLLEPLYLTEMMEREQLIRKSLENRDLVDEARNYNLFPKRRKLDCSFLKKPREFMNICEGIQETDKKIYSLNAEVMCSLVCLDTIRKRWYTKMRKRLLESKGCVAALHKKMCFFNSSYAFVYDSEQNKCEVLQHLTEPRYNAAAVTLRNKIFVCGGYTHSGQTVSTVECFDPEKKEWTAINSLHTARCRLNAVSLGDYIYVLGGKSLSEIYNSVERYSSATGKWQYMSPMLIPRHNAAAAVLNCKIYACGGNISLTKAELTATAEVYDPFTNKWKLISSVNTARSVTTLLAFYGNLYAIGGEDSWGKALNSCEVYDPLTNTWTFGTPNTVTHRSLAAAVM